MNNVISHCEFLCHKFYPPKWKHIKKHIQKIAKDKDINGPLDISFVETSKDKIQGWFISSFPNFL